MKRLIAATLFALAAPAYASGPGEHGAAGTHYLEGSRLTYEVFEAAVPHMDLENCPAEFDTDAVFCRLTLASEQANVFVFDLEGEQLLLAVKHYALDSDFLPF